MFLLWVPHYSLWRHGYPQDLMFQLGGRWRGAMVRQSEWHLPWVQGMN
jgi:hypothetical protein